MDTITNHILSACPATVPELAGMSWPAIFAQAKGLTSEDPMTLSPAARAQHPALLMTHLRARDLMGDFTDAPGAVDAAWGALEDGDAMTAMWALDKWSASHPTAVLTH